jgi:glycosyltransferase involved in cell wall biosynthesis
MKILLFLDGLGSGGAERQLIELAKGFKIKGYHPEILIYRNVYHNLSELKKNNIPLLEIEKKGKIDFKFILSLITVVKKENPDFIISYKTIPNIWMLLVANIINFNDLIISERNIDIQYHRYRAMIERLLSKKAKYIITNSWSAKKILIEKLKFSKDKIKVINNGIDIDNFLNINEKKLNEYQQKLKIKSDFFNIGLVGRIERQKNHILAIKALNKIIEKYPRKSMMLHCFGPNNDKELYDRLLMLIKKYKIEGTVIFYKPIEEIKYVYHLMDLIILPSLYEGFPNVILEAMCCSKIIIASDVSDNARIIDDNKNGFIFKNNDLEAFICKIERALNLDPDLKIQIGENAYKKIVNNYSREKMIEKYDELLKSI